MDLISTITQNQKNPGISAPFWNNQILNYILQMKDSTSTSLKDIIMLEIALDLTLWNLIGFNEQ